MANYSDRNSGGGADVDLSESSVHGEEQTEFNSDEVATEDRIDRLEEITGGAEEESPAFEGELEKQFDALDASTEEELDALRVNLIQDGSSFDAEDGSGRIADEVAEEQIAAFTEVGPASEDRGGKSVAPGREDTSAVLRLHRPRPDIEDSDAPGEGNIDPPLDEDPITDPPLAEENDEDKPEAPGQRNA